MSDMTLHHVCTTCKFNFLTFDDYLTTCIPFVFGQVTDSYSAEYKIHYVDGTVLTAVI